MVIRVIYRAIKVLLEWVMSILYMRASALITEYSVYFSVLLSRTLMAERANRRRLYNYNFNGAFPPPT